LWWWSTRGRIRRRLTERTLSSAIFGFFCFPPVELVADIKHTFPHFSSIFELKKMLRASIVRCSSAAVAATATAAKSVVASTEAHWSARPAAKQFDQGGKLLRGVVVAPPPAPRTPAAAKPVRFLPGGILSAE
jgi:hypothetical protein